MFDTRKLKTFSWINVGNPDHEDFERLLNEYKIDEDNIIDILDPDEQPRIELEDDYKVIIVRFPIANREMDTTWHTEPLSIIEVIATINKSKFFFLVNISISSFKI